MPAKNEKRPSWPQKQRKANKSSMKVILVAGARPNFPKIAPIAAELRKFPDLFQTVVVHTGQHYDYKLSQVFFDDLELPPPDFMLDASKNSSTQMGDITRCSSFHDPGLYLLLAFSHKLCETTYLT